LTIFAAIAALFTILAVGVVAWPLLRAGDSPHPVAATLTAIAIPAAVLVTYLLVSNYGWRDAPAAGAAASASPAAAAGSLEDAVASLERRLAAEPGDEEGWLLLGSSYLNLDRAADAAKAYSRALDISGGRNVDARLGLAEAKIVLEPGSLTGPVGDDIEAVLAAEPRNPKGLWYGGLLGLARGQPELARERWSALLELSPPERVRQIIVSQLAELDSAAGGQGRGPSGAVPAQPASGGTGVTVSVAVSVSPAMKSQLAASAPLFVFLRDGGNAGPPLAVIRRQASDLPVTLQITDADVMLPGRSLAGLQSAKLVARVANGGDPVAKPGDVYGEVQWARGPANAGPVALVIDRVVGR
jgi:cytochrome c-type biogenesis protein CcmH